MSTTTPATTKNEVLVKFNFYQLRFTPYNRESSNNNSRTILEKVITFLSQEQVAGRGLLIDKHQDRENNSPRPLFVTSTTRMLREKRIRVSMALLRSGKIPFLKPADKFLLVPLDTSNGEIAEQTHFFIDYNKDSIVLCAEFNSNGPRISDIEYYFRIVARDKLRLAKATELEIFMDTSIDKTLADLKNVLNFDIKVQPQKLAQLDTALIGQYFTALTSLGNRIKPKFIKLEAMFQTQGKQIESSELNKEANTMVTSILRSFKAKPTNIDVFEQFVVKYEDGNGKEELFNLLKGKKEITKMVDVTEISGRKWYELIEKDLDDFVNNL